MLKRKSFQRLTFVAGTALFAAVLWTNADALMGQDKVFLREDGSAVIVRQNVEPQTDRSFVQYDTEEDDVQFGDIIKTEEGKQIVFAIAEDGSYLTTAWEE